VASQLGGGQMIVIDRKTGFLVGGSDPRKDGLALGW
jgi:gamma-glutamyltranspeptidase/glutathione hydrolase